MTRRCIQTSLIKLYGATLGTVSQLRGTKMGRALLSGEVHGMPAVGRSGW